MAYEQKEGQGSLFKNDKRESDRHPNLTGSITIAGAKFWLSAWTKQRENGDKWISLAAKPADASPKAKDAPKDDIPF